MNIILIGFMGSGKSTLGVRLSYRMRQPFLDTDKYIEKNEGRSISEIFASDGEEAFRRIETETLIKMINGNLKDHVISTGGGMPINPANWDYMKKLGVVVWLRIQPETVMKRLEGDKTRPLLQGEDPQTKIRSLMEYRAPIYSECADIIVDVDNKPVERIMDEIFTKTAGVWKRKKKEIHR